MTLEALHAGLGWPAASALLVTSFFTSLIAAAFGLGGGAVMLAVLATLLPAAAIIPIHGVVQLGSNVGRAALMIRHTSTPVIWPFLIGSAIGVAFGGSLLVQLEPALLQIAVGLFILWTLVATPPAFVRRSAGIAGASSSFLTMFVGATGPFVAAFVRSLGLERHGYVATHAVLMTTQHLLKSIAFGLFGFAFGHWLPLIAGIVATGFLGTLAGRHVLARIDEARFRLILQVILGVLGLRLVVSGAQDYFGLSVF